jgi:hypothetical protein
MCSFCFVAFYFLTHPLLARSPFLFNQAPAAAGAKKPKAKKTKAKKTKAKKAKATKK